MTGLDSAIQDLEQALASDPRQTWQQMVRQRLEGVHEALASDRSRAGDSWLAARESRLRRERGHLVERLGRLGELEDIDALTAELRRLLHDLEHYRQRVHDLVYDSVSMDLGGSE